MVIQPRASLDEARLASELAKLEKRLRPDVVKIKYSLGYDSAGDPALFLRVLLTDDAAKPDSLGHVIDRVEELIFERIDPLNSWGVIAYPSYRSQSEQASLKEPAWA